MTKKRKAYEPAYTVWKCSGCLTTFEGFMNERDANGIMQQTQLSRVIQAHALIPGHSLGLVERRNEA